MLKERILHVDFFFSLIDGAFVNIQNLTARRKKIILYLFSLQLCNGFKMMIAVDATIQSKLKIK